MRVAIYAQIVTSECASKCSAFQEISERAVPKSTLSQHFKALREAGLIRGERCGNEMHHTSRCQEIQQRFPGLIAAIVNAHHIQSKQKARSTANKRRPRGTK